MRAVILKEPSSIERNPLSPVELPKPTPKKNEVLVRVKSCGVCHTDLHIAEGELIPHSYPLVLGHQIIGIVEELGANVKKIKAGEIAGVGWIADTCGNCFFCQNKNENLCDKAEFTGFSKQGGYAEFVCVDEDFVFKIPANLNDVESAPLMCAGVIGYRSFRLAQIKEGEHLGLFGFGASAHIVIQIAKYFKCTVSVFTRTEEHKKLAEELGADWIGSIDEDQKKPLDSAITFAPSGKIIPPALEKLRKGGTLAINAIHLDSFPPLNFQKHLYFEKTVRSVTSYTPQDALEFLELAAKIPIRTKTERFKLEEANEALKLLKESKINGAGVICI